MAVDLEARDLALIARRNISPFGNPRTIPKEETLANLQAMATRALAAGKAVVLLLMLPRVGTGWAPITDGASQNALARELRRVNRQLRLWHRALPTSLPLLVDVTLEIADPASAEGMGRLAALFDGLHPNG